MALPTSPFPNRALAALNRAATWLLAPTFWTTNRLLDLRPTTAERAELRRRRCAWCGRAMVAAALTAALLLSLPLAAMGLVLWLPAQAARRPFVYQVAAGTAPATPWDLRRRRGFTFVTANVCLLPSGLAKFSNLGRTPRRADAIARCLAPASTPLRGDRAGLVENGDRGGYGGTLHTRNGLGERGDHGGTPHANPSLEDPDGYGILHGHSSVVDHGGHGGTFHANPSLEDPDGYGILHGRSSVVDHGGHGGTFHANTNPVHHGEPSGYGGILHGHSSVVDHGGHGGTFHANTNLEDHDGYGILHGHSSVVDHGDPGGTFHANPSLEDHDGYGILHGHSSVVDHDGHGGTFHANTNLEDPIEPGGTLHGHTPLVDRDGYDGTLHTTQPPPVATAVPAPLVELFPADADFVCLQEVFDADAAECLRRHLAGSFRHLLSGVGALGLRGWRLKLLDSGLLVASRYPVLAARFHPFPNGAGEDAWASKGVLAVQVLLGSARGQRLVGYLGCTHLQAPAGDGAVRDAQLALSVRWLREFREQQGQRGDRVVFDVFCGDLNFDNCSPAEGLSNQRHRMFELYRDPCREGPGRDKPWAIGTLLNSQRIYEEAVSTPEKMRRTLSQPDGRQRYLAGPILPDGRPDPAGAGAEQGRRVDYILYRPWCGAQVLSTEVAEVSFITQLATRSDHLPVALRLNVGPASP